MKNKIVPFPVRLIKPGNENLKEEDEFREATAYINLSSIESFYPSFEEEAHPKDFCPTYVTLKSGDLYHTYLTCSEIIALLEE